VSNNTSVRAIYRRSHKLESVKKVFSYYTNDVDNLYNKIEWIEANINDVHSLEPAFTGITHVYHCAAFISFEPDKYYELRKVNIKGTANIVNLCISNSIKKICYISSIAAIGKETHETTLITEKTEWNPEDDNSVYAITKYGAEMEVWRGTQEGVDAVIVNPGIILGPGFWKGGGSGSLFRQIHKGLKYYPKGTSAYVDVWDVVDCMTQLMEGSLKNERYILIAENLPFKTFQDKVAKALHVKPSKKEASSFLLSIAWRLDWLSHKLFGKRRKLSRQLAKSISSKTIFDNSKLKKDLDFNFTPIDESISKVSKYYLETSN
jgi:nucleoside-diphosphate-sugar epimerase